MGEEAFDEVIIPCEDGRGEVANAYHPISYDATKAQEQRFREQHPNWNHTPIERSRAQIVRTIHVWNALLERQNGHDLDDGQVGPLENKVVRYSRSFAPVALFPKMLIVGAGVGREVLEAKGAGYCGDEYSAPPAGVTLGPMNVAFGKEMLGVSLIQADAHALELKTGAFDVIVACQTLEHSWAPLMLLIEFCRLLRPGGKVIIETPPSAQFTMGRELHHALCPTPWQLRGLLLKAGFLDVGMFKTNGDPIDDHECHDEIVGVGTRWDARRAEEVEPVIRAITAEL